MERKYVWAGAALAVALLLPLGNWVIASHQNTVDQQQAKQIQQQFAARLTSASSSTQPQADGGGPWAQRRGADSGQRQRGAGQWGQRRAKMQEAMAKEVGLSPTQLNQLQAVRDSARPMMSDIFRNPQLTREQKRAQMQQLMQAQQAQISKFLSPDQQAKYTAFQEKMRAERQARRQQNGGAGGWPDGGVGSANAGNTTRGGN